MKSGRLLEYASFMYSFTCETALEPLLSTVHLAGCFTTSKEYKKGPCILGYSRDLRYMHKCLIYDLKSDIFWKMCKMT